MFTRHFVLQKRALELMDRQAQQQASCGSRAPGRPAEDAVMVHGAPLIREPADAQNAGRRARAGCLDGAD